MFARCTNIAMFVIQKYIKTNRFLHTKIIPKLPIKRETSVLNLKIKNKTEFVKLLKIILDLKMNSKSLVFLLFVVACVTIQVSQN